MLKLIFLPITIAFAVIAVLLRLIVGIAFFCLSNIMLIIVILAIVMGFRYLSG